MYGLAIKAQLSGGVEMVLERVKAKADSMVLSRDAVAVEKITTGSIPRLVMFTTHRVTLLAILVT